MSGSMVRFFVSIMILSCGRPGAAPPAFGSGAPPEEKAVVESPIFVPPPVAPVAPSAASEPVVLSACPDVCRDRALPAGVVQALGARAKASRRCYERELAKDPNLSVRTTIAVRLLASGAPCDVAVLATDSQVVSDCVADFFRSPAFPSPGSDCAVVNVPISFVSSN